MRREERGTDGKRSVTERAEERERDAEEKRKKKKSEMTKCNLSAFSD